VAEQTKTDSGTAETGGRVPARHLVPIAAWLRSGLFRPADPGPGGPGGPRAVWLRILGGAAFVVAGAAVSLSRTEGPGALNTIWIEDAGNFLQDALHESVLTTLTTQMNGYYDVVPRAITAVAMAFPLRWVPGIMSACAALLYAAFGLIAYIASGPYLRGRWLRLLVAVPACVVPLGYTQANNDLATVQFIALYGTFWLLLWMPASRAGRLASPVIVLGITLSSILPAVFAPLAAARVIADRSKSAIALVSCWAAGLLIQLSVQLRGMSNRSADWFTNPLWVLGNYVTRAVPRAIFGELALGGPGTNGEGHLLPLPVQQMAEHNVLTHNALIWGAWAVVLAAVIIGLAGRTAPHWPLAVTALLFSVLVFLGEIIDNLPIVQPRYVIAPALLLYTAIAAMLRPRGDADPAAPRRAIAARIPVAVFALLLAVVCGFNFRVDNNRSQSPPWTAVVAAARKSCTHHDVTEYLYRHAWWRVDIPCGRVRR
jgi:hypothetical protein